MQRMKGKRTPTDRDKSIIGFEADRELRVRIEAEAEKLDRPRSWVIRQLLLRALAQNEKTA